jgi:CMP-N-acetylneuraminic acid synthetase
MKNIAFIFARGGSKGLPRKNIKLLAGKPLIQYSIESALQSPSISAVFVSTEDKEIAAISSSLGAVVIDRPEKLSADDSPEWLAWRHAIDWVEVNYGVFDGFISLPATSPLRSVEDIEAAISKLSNTQADICISVTPSSRNPFFNMVTVDFDGIAKRLNSSPENITRRQDAPVIYDVTTVVYVTSPGFIKSNTGIFSGRVVTTEVPKYRAVDIDDIYDFKFAESLLEHHQ